MRKLISYVVIACMCLVSMFVIEDPAGGLDSEASRTGSRGVTIISTNTTWTTGNSPYTLTGDVQVTAGATLTINPGVVVNYAGPYEMLVKGTLVAVGTKSQRITFSNSSTAGPEGIRLIKFEGTNLTASQMSYVTLENAQMGIQIGEETEHAQGGKNNGTLSVDRVKLINTGVLTDGYQTTADLFINHGTFIGSTIVGNYPRSEPIRIWNSVFTDCLINSDSYNFGVTVKNSDIEDSELSIGCCGANMNLRYCNIRNSTIYDYNDYYTIEITGCRIFNTPINLEHTDGTTTFITNSTFKFSGDTGMSVGELHMDSTIIMGEGDGVGIYFTRDGGTITNSTIMHNSIAINLSYSDTLSIKDCNFLNNTDYNIHNLAQEPITATNNFWHTTNTGTIATKIHDYHDDINNGEVTWQPLRSSIYTIPNTYPMAYAGPDKVVKPGATLQFDGSGSYKSGGGSLSYRWDFGDGKTTTWSNNPYTVHNFTQSGNYAVTLAVNDGTTKDWDICNVEVTKVNQAPVSNAGPDLNGTANQTVTFNGSGSYDPDGDNLTYNWLFGDGSSTGWQTSPNSSHIYAMPGKYTATLKAKDLALVDSDTCFVTVAGNFSEGGNGSEGSGNETGGDVANGTGEDTGDTGDEGGETDGDGNETGDGVDMGDGIDAGNITEEGPGIPDEVEDGLEGPGVDDLGQGASGGPGNLFGGNQVGAEMSVDAGGEYVANSYSDGIEMELITIDTNLIAFNIRGESDTGKVVIFNLHRDSEFGVPDPDDVMVRMDGDTVTSTFYTTVLFAQGDTPLYCLTTGQEGMQIILYIPHFSEHTVTVEKKSGPAETESASLNMAAILLLLVITMVLVLTIFFYRRYRGLGESGERSEKGDDVNGQPADMTFDDDGDLNGVRRSHVQSDAMLDSGTPGSPRRVRGRLPSASRSDDDIDPAYLPRARSWRKGDPRSGDTRGGSPEEDEPYGGQFHIGLDDITMELRRRDDLGDEDSSGEDLLTQLKAKYRRGGMSKEAYDTILESIGDLEE